MLAEQLELHAKKRGFHFYPLIDILEFGRYIADTPSNISKEWRWYKYIQVGMKDPLYRYCFFSFYPHCVHALQS